MAGTSIRQTMSLRRKAPLFVLVVLLQLLVKRAFNGHHVFLLASADSSIDIAVDEHLVEKILSDCVVDGIDVGEVIRSVDNSILRDIIQNSSATHLDTSKLSEDSLGEVISLLSQEIKERFFDLLSKQNLPLVSENGKDLKSEHDLYLECLLGWIHTSRRSLANQPSQTAVPALSPGPAISPASSPVPATASAHASAPSPHIGAKSRSPPHSSTPPPPFFSSPDDNSPAPSPDMFSWLFADKKNPHIASDLPKKDQSSNTKVLVTAVVLSILGTLLIAAVFFVFYKKCHANKGYTRYSIRDDRPLLSLSMSDLPGSSHKPFGMINSFEKNNLTTSSFSTKTVQFSDHSSLNVDSTEVPAAKFHATTLGSSTEQFGKPNKALTPKPAPPTPIMAPPVPKPPPPPVPKTAPPAPVPPPPPPNKKPGAPPPVPPKAVLPPRSANLKPPGGPRSSPSGLKQSNNAGSDDGNENADTSAPKTKLKPFFWDKVVANPDHSMVWDQIKAGSFQFNEEMIESLFGYVPANKPKNEEKDMSSKNTPQYIRILDPKKSQNLAISLKALNVNSELVCHTITEGGRLPVELLQTLLKMPPTTDEELRLRLYTGNLSELGPAEQFLKALVEIPSAYQRLDALLLMASLPEEFSSTKDAFLIIEAACEELKNSRLFLKLLEAVLKTGNRMNDGTYRGSAQAFKLDTLLKLADVKGTDGKTTLLQFVVQEIIRSEGVRAVRVAREQNKTISGLTANDFADDSLHESEDYLRKIGLKVVSGVGNELGNVKKAAGLDSDALTGTVVSLGHRLLKTKDFLNTSLKSMEEESGFHRSLKLFVEQAEPDVTFLLEEEKRIRSLVQKTTDFFHGKEGKDEGFRLFVIVKNFLGMLDKTCKQVSEAPRRVIKAPVNKEAPSPSASPARDPRELLFPAIRDRRIESSSSSDDES